MGRYIIVTRGFGKYRRKRVQPISSRKAEKLEEKGETIYNSKEEAEERC